MRISGPIKVYIAELTSTIPKMTPSSLLASVVLLVSSLYVYASPLASGQQTGSDPNIMTRGLGGNGPIPVDNGNNDMVSTHSCAA